MVEAARHEECPKTADFVDAEVEVAGQHEERLEVAAEYCVM